MAGFLQSTGFMPPSEGEYRRNTVGSGGSLGGFSPGFLPPFQAAPTQTVGQQNPNDGGAIMAALQNLVRGISIPNAAGTTNQSKPPISQPGSNQPPPQQNQVQGVK